MDCADCGLTYCDRCLVESDEEKVKCRTCHDQDNSEDDDDDDDDDALKESLGNALSEVTTPGSFAASSVCDATAPAIHIKGVGRLAYPSPFLCGFHDWSNQYAKLFEILSTADVNKKRSLLAPELAIAAAAPPPAKKPTPAPILIDLT